MSRDQSSQRSRAQDLLDRFLRYVRIDTQSDESSTTSPSTAKQLDLLRLLDDELRALGCHEVHLDRFGYVTATIPSTLPRGATAPVIGFLAHVDTSPEITGTGVKAIVWRRYDGGEIRLPGDPSQVVDPSESPALRDCVGHDLITSDGTTLLGADDKAGVAEIVTAASYLLAHPEIPHGSVRLAFTPDEEIGRGTEHFDVAGFGAEAAYTLDGDTVGTIEYETFNADAAVVEIHGRNVHPGYAKGALVNSLKLAADLIGRLPPDRLSPETTDGRQGYLHPLQIDGVTELTRIKFIVRDFTRDGLRETEDLLRQIAADVVSEEPRARIEVRIQESYRNMGEILVERKEIIAKAEEAIRRAGVTPRTKPIRGGTDGARLTFAGLPTPNLFAGGHNFHSKREWVSLQDMDRAVETIVRLAEIWGLGSGV
ncbi:MAG TPA: peptidase T [Chloroflexota bacterium]|nr:peptidase T [Chloroflexota bacterium]